MPTRIRHWYIREYGERIGTGKRSGTRTKTFLETVVQYVPGANLGKSLAEDESTTSLQKIADTYKNKSIILEEAHKFLEIKKRADFDDELLKYFVYLTFFTVLILWIFPISHTYEQVNLVQKYFSSESNPEFVDYESVLVQDNIYEFLESTIATGIFSDQGMVGMGVQLLGLPLLRQIRVNPSTCQLSGVYEECYGFYDDAKEAKKSFGPPEDPKRYVYKTGYPRLEPSYAFSHDWHVGEHDSYGQGAYAVTLPYGTEATSQLLSQLKNDSWINRSTRAVAVNVGFVNADIGFLTSAEFLFELSPSGRIEPTRRVMSFPLLIPSKSQSVGEFVFYIFFVLGGLYYVVSEFQQMHDLGIDYVKDSWNIFEVINYIIFVILMIGIAIFSYYSGECLELVDDATATSVPSDYIDIQTTSQIYYVLQMIVGVSCMFGFIKVFKFFRLNNRLNLLGETLGKAAGDLMAYVLIFIIIFISFSFQGYLFFGYEIEGYHNFSSAVLSTFRILAGDSEYESMRYASPVLAPLFFLLFVVVIILILVNMFVAILSEYYEQAKEDSRRKAEEQKEQFKDDTDYDLVERFMSVRPHLNRVHGTAQSYVQLGVNDPVLVVFIDKSSDNVKHLNNLITNIPSVKFLQLRSNSIEAEGLQILLKKRNIFKFSPSSSAYPYVLTLRKVDESKLKTEMPDTCEDIDKATKGLKGLKYLVFRSMDDYNVDQNIYVRLDFELIKEMTNHLFQSLWNHRMTLKGSEPKIVTGIQLERIFKRVMAFDEFNRRANRDTSNLVTLKGLYKSIGEQAEEDGKNSLATKSIEKTIHEFMLEQQQSSSLVKVGFDDFAQQLQLDLSMTDPSKLETLNIYDIKVETVRVFKSFPKICIEDVEEMDMVRSYNPRLINTSHIDVGEYNPIMEELAEHIHDQWTLSKLTADWRYGPTRDNINKIHPDMKPYMELSNETKEYDRRMAKKTIKLVKYFGYKITRERGPIEVEVKDLSKYKDMLPSNYDIKLPNFDEIKYDASLSELIEIMSSSVHDEWARARINQGWTYSEVSSDEHKTTNFLKPYFHLTNKEQDNDRNTVVATIKFLIYKGYKIERITFNSFLVKTQRAVSGFCREAMNSVCSCFNTQGRTSNPSNTGTPMQQI
eukprot:TRINITY_DN3539_c0_g1_i3.p1 TRINITY_DN3539_c0_g1~~TRINITY_DN3539_c0_g1_i3.p1  ORF type:complete len:1133 (+),score=222.66 TRINITY_DN3539_c0_g1_i3:432-3830(+)